MTTSIAKNLLATLPLFSPGGSPQVSFPAGHSEGDAFHQKDKLVPAHGTEAYALAQEYP